MAFSILNRHSNSVGSETRRGGSHFLLPVLVFSFFLPVVASAAVPADLTTTTYYIKSAPDGSLMRTERALVGFEINVRNVTPLASWQSNALVQSPTVGSSLVSRSTLYDLGGNWILDNQRLCAGAPPAGGCSNFRLKGFLQYYSIGAQVTVRAVPALGYRFIKWTGVPYGLTGSISGLSTASGPRGFALTPCAESINPTCSFRVSNQLTGLRAVFDRI
ncbi:MAG: hypothetical protein UY68_C0005G0065 [Parcubacteria group bacterium GW2011_GWF2_52_12]|nr:MAG: hypothetical protein UY68_C0005G0065 [Parcubacteria group bacterium GW2011_GWF2_52_12]